MQKRGNGLAGLLSMQRSFAIHLEKFENMINRMNELEATNALLAKLDLNELVSLEKLEDRLQIEFARIEKNHFDRSVLFENKIETFKNTVDEKA